MNLFPTANLFYLDLSLIAVLGLFAGISARTKGLTLVSLLTGVFSTSMLIGAPWLLALGLSCLCCVGLCCVCDESSSHDAFYVRDTSSSPIDSVLRLETPLPLPLPQPALAAQTPELVIVDNDLYHAESATPPMSPQPYQLGVPYQVGLPFQIGVPCRPRM